MSGTLQGLELVVLPHAPGLTMSGASTGPWRCVLYDRHCSGALCARHAAVKRPSMGRMRCVSGMQLGIVRVSMRCMQGVSPVQMRALAAVRCLTSMPPVSIPSAGPCSCALFKTCQLLKGNMQTQRTRGAWCTRRSRGKFP